MNWRQEPDGRPPDNLDDTWNYASQDEQLTQVTRMEDVTKPCGNPHCPTRIVKRAAREFCSDLCTVAWELRGEVWAGELCDWPRGIHWHLMREHQPERTPLSVWSSQIEEAFWQAIHTPAEVYASLYPVEGKED